ncbi:uncharacterized protein E0L32_004008 [Thyridium curvatum]|uniref:Haloacid dehalogenase n=1 Tax=Thyridium curvatum TaxID=1093900 RepID=A0A507BGB6_9PEZI|nr:uncharacterized protein E0L32_004008 [Thyridium curvatum]TPX16359.1 hypothetical protein E0L32_004008 [Thyridium curvatum]
MAFDPTKVKGLFFDIYATLINWEDGIYKSLYELAWHLPSFNPLHADTPETRQKLLRMFAATEKTVEHENPTMKYSQVLEEVYERIAIELGLFIDIHAQAAFGRSIGDWPAYPDTVAAMQVLARHYKLCVLSNVDDASFARTCAGPLKGVHWDGVYTAEQIGSYKPDHRNYNFVVDRFREDFGIAKDEIVMVAQSLDIDHVTCTELGFRPGVWIARSGSDMGGHREELESKGLLELGAVYPTLGAMAEAVEKAFAEKQ